MSIPEIPDSVNDWTIETIDSLLDIEIESEKLECKRELTKNLPKSICAMANTCGGFIIIGLDEVKDSETGPRFKKNGLNVDEDECRQKIANFTYSVDPVPRTSINCIKSNDSKIYPIIQVSEEESKKPFSVKDSGTFFIRIDNTSKPAPRSMILKMLVNSDYKHNIVALRTALKILKSDLGETRSYIKSISVSDQTCKS